MNVLSYMLKAQSGSSRVEFVIAVEGDHQVARGLSRRRVAQADEEAKHWSKPEYLQCGRVSISRFAFLPAKYRVTLVVEYLGWVDLDWRCSTILLGQ